jgi:hypothetical protein
MFLRSVICTGGGGRGHDHDIQHKNTLYKDTQYNNTLYNDIQHNDTQHNDTRHNDIQYNDIQYNNKLNTKLSIMMLRIMTSAMGVK